MSGHSRVKQEIFASAEVLSQGVAEWMLGIAMAKTGYCAICLSGGSTPRRLYECLAGPRYRDLFPWPRTHWFWGDERFVPRDDAMSNYRMAREALLSHAPIPPDNIHAVPTEGMSPGAAASAYERELKSFYGGTSLDPSRPLFDVTLLGLGLDGHVASLFPDTAVLMERDRWVAAVVGAKAEARITLTYPVIDSSRHVAFLVVGEEKRKILSRFRRGDDSLPAAHVRPIGKLWVFADMAAAEAAGTLMHDVGSNQGAASPERGPRTLAIDVGGTGLKATVLDADGKMIVERVRVATPYPCDPEILLGALAELTAPLPAADRVSIGFPGVIRGGRVLTAPHFGTDVWRGCRLEELISDRFGKPARLLNDAEVQGLGIIAGTGLEVVLTLGTGVGSAVFSHGALTPHLELAQHPIHKSKTYNEYVGGDAYRALGSRKWNRRVLRMIEIVKSLLNYDVLYLGGGNAANIVVDLPENVRLASNDAGITGGIRLWDDGVWRASRRR